MKCYNCNADIDANSLFCEYCGASQIGYRICPQCEQIYHNEGAKYCSRCGNKLTLNKMLADSLMPYIHNGQIGYKSTIDNRVYITPQYYWAGCFNEGLAPVSIKDITQKSIKKQKRAGCIDTLGEIVIPFEYCHVSAFNEDRAVVQSYWGYGNMCSYHSSVIDTEGKLIHIPVEFDSIDSYYERRAIIKKLDEESGYVSAN